MVDECEGKVTRQDLVERKKEGKESRLVGKHIQLSNIRKNIEIDKTYLCQVERQRQEEAAVGNFEIIRVQEQSRSLTKWSEEKPPPWSSCQEILFLTTMIS